MVVNIGLTQNAQSLSLNRHGVRNKSGLFAPKHDFAAPGTMVCEVEIDAESNDEFG